MKKKDLLVLGLAAALGVLMFRTANTRHRSARPVAMEQADPASDQSTSESRRPGETDSVDQDRALKKRPGRLSKAESPNAQSNRETAEAAAILLEQAPVTLAVYYSQAREALSLVGADPDAEEFWIAAINDPSFTAKQREDLIEDLNEEGFEDPKHPTEDELPLVLNRLLLIEQLAPDAMDAANADSFAEAYKDLWNIYTRLTAE
jgi:hypothetical protein